MSVGRRRDPDMTESRSATSLPDTLMIAFDGAPQLSLAGQAMSIDTWEREEGGPPEACTVAVKCRSMALHVEFDAQSLRAHGAACLRIADKLDGGRGKQ